jgi:amino acid adenylation domain-containing protein
MALKWMITPGKAARLGTLECIRHISLTRFGVTIWDCARNSLGNASIDGNDAMSNTTELSETKRALLEKYLRGTSPQIVTGVDSIARRAPGKPVPLSFGQQQLWLLAQLIPDTPVYNESVTVHMPGPLDVAALEQSLNEILRRHESWRTGFPIVDGQPAQVIHSSLQFALSPVDLRQMPRHEREAEALRIATEDAQQPFDLVHGPLLRATLIRLDDMDHRLFITLHHIIFDGVTIYQVFLPELRALYEAFATGQPSPLPELPIQYADFAVWQREWLQGKVLTDQLAYWKKQLEGAPATLELPTDRPRPSLPTYRGRVQSFALPQSLTNALRTLSSREGSTLYMTLTAAFNTLLYRYTGQEDILIGTATGGRKQPEVQKLMGVFINTLVMRTNLSGDPTFRELLGRVREVTIEATSHQDIPFEYLVKELQPDREMGQNPLFQVLLMLEPSVPALPSGWTLTHMEVDTETSKFDLSLILEDRPEGLLAHFEYSTDLFDAATIERMVGHWQTLLDGIIANPDQRLSELPLLTEAESRQLLREWNATETEYPKQCVHQIFENQAERVPDEVALIFDEQQMTYRELNQRANQLAHRLQRLGVGTEVLVALCMDRSLEMVVSLLAILKAGGAYVPLDPSYPTERLAFMLEDTQAPVILTQQHFVASLPTQGVQVICPDSEWDEIAHESEENLVNRTMVDNLAYVMYTSGSTGKPKGVEIRHRSINRLVFGVDYARLDATRTILHMASISFDAATLEVWGALLHGARCILFPERIPTPKSIGALVQKHQVTTSWLTASLFNAIIDEAPEALQGIEQLLVGGEALSVVHIRRALEKLPGTQLINGYGPTESTTFTCCYPIPRHLGAGVRSIPIGRPIGNTQVYILDKHLHPVPIGVPGELYIGGAGLARGYFHRPELTKEKFIAHPFTDERGAQLYKTGDLVRYLPDGSIDFLGRLDHQVKLRGFRIELGEIEAVLGQHAAVREALVIAHQDERGEKHLVAYVVAQIETNSPPHATHAPRELQGRQGQEVTPNELRDFLKEHLPEYMVPSDFIMLEAMPLTPNGKVDRRALPKPDLARRTAEENFVAPVLAVHQKLVEIWEDVLNVRPIGIKDNFFSLGGHSLLAARMIDRIEQNFGKKLPLATFFAGATIEHLATVLQDEQQITDSRTPVVRVQAGGTTRPLFFLHGDWAGGGFYCIDLSHDLGTEQPFYILEPYKFNDLPVPPSFEEMASAHIESLQKVQPEGPYLLGGFCNGGLMAYEIARQLHAKGQKVDFLALIDPATPAPHKWIRRAISTVGKLTHAGEDKQLDWFLWYLYMRIPAYRNKVKNSIISSSAEQNGSRPGQAKAGSIRSKLASLAPEKEALRYQWSGMYRYVAAGYLSGSYPGKITLFWSTEGANLNKKWCETIGVKEVEIQVIPGTHKGWKTENLHLLADRLKVSLSKIQ